MSNLSAKNNPPSKSFESSIHEKEGVWWVAKVKPRQEKAFAFDLLKQGMDYYLPYYERKTKRSDGKFRKSVLVLFPSYVPFISDEPYSFLAQGRVSTILPISQQQRFKRELHYIFMANASNIPIEPVLKPEPHVLGEPIEIVSGPLSGAVGIIADIQNENRTVMLSIDGLGYAKVTVGVEMVKSRSLTEKLETRIYDKPLLMSSAVLPKNNKRSIFASGGPSNN